MNEAATHGGSGRREDKPQKGFCFKFKTPDLKQRVFVNVCGHFDVGLPQGHSGVPVDSDYVAAHGIDNLQVPIAVGPLSAEAKPSSQGLVTCSVDVVVHPCITELCQCVWRVGNMDGLPPLKARIVSRMVALALDWVKRETGVAAAVGSVVIITDTAYRNAALTESQIKGKQLADAFKSLSSMTPEQLATALKEDINVAASQEGADGPQAPQVADIFKLPDPKPSAAQPKRPMVTEVSPEPVIKRGFLNKPGGPGLYGEEGTKEGVLPEGAGDPLGYLPKELRTKCKVIDARDGTPAADALRNQRHRSAAELEFLEAMSNASATAVPTRTVPAPAPVRDATPNLPAVSTEGSSADGFRSSNGITIHDVGEVPPPLGPSYVSVCKVADGGGIEICVDLTGASAALGTPITSMNQLDVTTEPTEILCELEGGAVVFRVAAENGWFVDELGRSIDVDGTNAKFLKSQRRLVLSARFA